MKKAVGIAFLLLAMPVMADPADIALALRVTNEMASIGSIIRAGALMPPPGISPAPFERAYREELAAHPEWIIQANKAYAGFLTDQLDHDQLQAMADYYETPTAREITEKMHAATESARVATLTPEEHAAEDAFFNSDEGKAIRAKLASATLQSINVFGPLLQTIKIAAMKRYCAEGGDCTNMKFPDPNHF